MGRRFTAMRCRKITDIAFSSTLKASELKNSIVANNTQPTAALLSRKSRSSCTTCLDWPGTTNSRARRRVASSSPWSITCDSTITMRISSGTIDSSA